MASGTNSSHGAMSSAGTAEAAPVGESTADAPVPSLVAAVRAVARQLLIPMVPCDEMPGICREPSPAAAGRNRSPQIRIAVCKRANHVLPSGGLPTTNYGQTMCLSIHLIGRCSPNCTNWQSHRPLTAMETASMLEFRSCWVPADGDSTAAIRGICPAAHHGKCIPQTIRTALWRLPPVGACLPTAGIW